MVAEMSPSTYILAVLVLSTVGAITPPVIISDEPAVLEQENNFNGTNTVGAIPPPVIISNEPAVLEQENNFNGTDSGSNNTVSCESQEEPAVLPADGEIPANTTWTSPECVTFNVTYTLEEDLGWVPTLTQLGDQPFDGDQRKPGTSPFGRPEDGFPNRPSLSGNAALSLIG